MKIADLVDHLRDHPLNAYERGQTEALSSAIFQLSASGFPGAADFLAQTLETYYELRMEGVQVNPAIGYEIHRNITLAKERGERAMRELVASDDEIKKWQTACASVGHDIFANGEGNLCAVCYLREEEPA